MLRFSAGGVVALACMVVGCAEDERHYLMTDETLVQAEGEQWLGGGCMAVTDGTHTSTGGGSAALSGPALKYGITFEGREDGVRVVVVGGDHRIVRDFDEAWLNGERAPETVEVPIDEQHRYRVRLSGGASCVTSPPP